MTTAARSKRGPGLRRTSPTVRSAATVYPSPPPRLHLDHTSAPADASQGRALAAPSFFQTACRLVLTQTKPFVFKPGGCSGHPNTAAYPAPSAEQTRLGGVHSAEYCSSREKELALRPTTALSPPSSPLLPSIFTVASNSPLLYAGYAGHSCLDSNLLSTRANEWCSTLRYQKFPTVSAARAN